MSFMGELSDVGLAELLSVLARGGLTGRLTINAISEEVIVYLSDGKVTQVSSSNQNLRLGRVLVRMGTITEAALKEAIREQAEQANARPLGQILASRQLVTAEQLSLAAQEQATDALSRVFGAHTGNFFFTRVERGELVSALMALNAEGIVLEASRRADEIGALWRMMPPAETKLVIDRGMVPIGNKLSANEQKVTMALGMEQLTVGALISRLADDERAVLRALVGLMERGIVNCGAIPGKEHLRAGKSDHTVMARSASEVRVLAGEGVGAGKRDWVPGLADVRHASPAGAQTIAKATRVVREVVGAFNAGLPLLAYAHFTDAYFRRLAPTAVDFLDSIDELNGPLSHEQHQTFVDLTDVRVLSDGRVSAIVITAMPDEAPQRKVLIFVEAGERCLIDAVIEPGKDRDRVTQTTMLSPTGLLERDRRVIRHHL